jgi:DeoR family fructose operon transcriptional repressor
MPLDGIGVLRTTVGRARTREVTVVPGRTNAAAGKTREAPQGRTARTAAEPPQAAPHEDTARAEQRIAAAAVAEVPQRGVVLLDAHPLTEHLADALPEGRDLTVVTNSMDIAVRLMAREDVTLLLIGGRIRSGATATVQGGSSMPGLEGLHIDVAFLAAAGVDARRGLTADDPVEAAAKRMMMRAADRVVVLAYGASVGHVALARYGTLRDVDCLITDSTCDPLAGDRAAVAISRTTRV